MIRSLMTDSTFIAVLLQRMDILYLRSKMHLNSSTFRRLIWKWMGENGYFSRDL